MLQYPVGLGIEADPSNDEESATELTSNVSEVIIAEVTGHQSVTSQSMGAGVAASPMSATSVMVGDAEEQSERSYGMDDSVVSFEGMDREFDMDMLSRSLYSGKLIPKIEEFDEEEEDSELRRVLDVLSLSEESRRRIRAEGIKQVSDLFEIEELLQHGKVSGLTSVETAKLLQFLAWARSSRVRHAQDSLPNVLRDYTKEEYQEFVECERTKKQTHVWPFPGVDVGETSILLRPLHCSVQDIETDGEDRVASQSITQREIRSARIRAFFSLAEDSHKDFHAGFGSSRLKDAMDRYRLVIQECALSVDDCKFQAFSCIKLAILLHRVEFQNIREAMRLMKIAAVKFKVPTGMFFYGTALVTGHGGVVKQDRLGGTAMLQDAAAAGIGEAYYILGFIHEGGGFVGGDVDLNTARLNYDAASRIFRSSVATKRWRGMFAETYSSSSQQAHHDGADASDTAGADHWDTELDEAHELVSVGFSENIFFRRDFLVTVEGFNWGFLVQAVLVVAAAILSTSSQASHYPALLPLVPCLGIVLALGLILHAVKVMFGNKFKRRLVWQMEKAKLTALQCLLKVERSCYCFIPPFHYFLLWYSKCAHWILVNGSRSAGKMKSIENLEANIIWLETRGSIAMAGFVSWLVEVLVLLLSIAFLSLWTILLAQEVQSLLDDCSNWWANTCQGSDVLCNEGNAKQEMCGLLATGNLTSSLFKLIPQT